MKTPLVGCSVPHFVCASAGPPTRTSNTTEAPSCAINSQTDHVVDEIVTAVSAHDMQVFSKVPTCLPPETCRVAKHITITS